MRQSNTPEELLKNLAADKKALIQEVQSRRKKLVRKITSPIALGMVFGGAIFAGYLLKKKSKPILNSSNSSPRTANPSLGDNSINATHLSLLNLLTQHLPKRNKILNNLFLLLK